MPLDPTFDINKRTFKRCVRAIRFLTKNLGLNIEQNEGEGHFESGQIFLFNHFARFETIIPSFLIYKATGHLSRCVADSGLFAGGGELAKLLWSLGGVPTNHPGLLSFLAAEILRGRKVIVFPEGGMLKSRAVVDDTGEFRILSPRSGTRRKHHRGASAIAVTLELFKKRILAVHKAGQLERLERWRDSLGMDTTEALLRAARRPTLTVPANITFYPIRISDNLFLKAAEMLGVKVSPRGREELLIEGNIILKYTDMTVRFGTPILPDVGWDWTDDSVLDEIFLKIKRLPDLFGLNPESDHWFDQLVSTELSQEIEELRDASMAEMYAQVTVNFSHLASLLARRITDRGEREVDREVFHQALYHAIKKLQQADDAHLHEGLLAPDKYRGIERGECAAFTQFLKTTTAAGLIRVLPDRYLLLPKLGKEFSLHEVRLENLVSVYANEVEPIPEARAAVEEGLKLASSGHTEDLTDFLFDDELRSYEYARREYSQPKHMEINAQATATQSGAPYLLRPNGHREDMGVILVHGFLSSPAELRSFGEELAEQGYPVLGVRVAGHGTSPWDLRDRTWEDWIESVRQGFELMNTITERVCVVGFSGGGAMALRFAADNPRGLAGVAGVAPAMKFTSRAMAFVPLLHKINRAVRRVSPFEGAKPFELNDSELPEINYRHMPIAAVSELLKLVEDLKERLPQMQTPALIVQGTKDPVVAAAGAKLIHAKIGTEHKRLHMIPSKRHSILYEDIGKTRAVVHAFIDELSQYH